MIKQYKDKPLNIYRASAGSGKTHLLTGFYIKLLFLRRLLPETHSGEMNFGEILAVTFTNKATAEMKERIIKEIFQLKNDPARSDYWEDLTGLKKIEKKEPIPTSYTPQADAVSKKASALLARILNEYSSFSISTIDSFFQKIVRSFARELNIPGNYEVELDIDRVLDAAVSNFLDKLDKKRAPNLFKWMEDFSTKRIEEGAGWDFRKELFELAKGVLTSEEYRSHKVAIEAFTNDIGELTDYMKMLTLKQRQWRERLVELGKEGVRAMEECGLRPEDFTGSSNSHMFHFALWATGAEKKPTDTFVKHSVDASGWFTKKSPYAKGLSQTSTDRILAVMQAAVAHYSGTIYSHYKTACALRVHFYELGILANIDRELTEYCNEQNFMLLSSTTEMLSRLIGDDDAPFIYEKTGTKIHSYMIDEFQDTSGMQWKNFMPLVSNALADNYQNLIVGDVKQSIYRWRGGDWNLLNTKINSYEQELHYDDKDSLRTNWRSLKNIVEFNNSFFPSLVSKLDTMLQSGSLITDIYSDVCQELPSKREKDDAPKGLVSVSFLEPTDEDRQPIEKPKKQDFIDAAKHRLPEVIIELQKNGYEANEIAILCRKNGECQWCAEALLRYKQEHPECPYCLDIISDEALTLGARPTIQALVSIMQHLLSPKAEIPRTVAWSNYLQLKGMSCEEALANYFDLKEEERNFHPELSHRPLYEMTEELIRLLPPEACKADAPFLQAFRDLVLDYASKQGSDLAGFVGWWEESGYKKSISIPEQQNALQIMTVHKSKGLGMPAIVMPYATWDIDIDTSHQSILWCKPREGDFKKEVLLPVELSEQLGETIFREEYERERQCAVIDNLNTAYVAFTRAKEALVILAPKPTKPASGKMNSRLEHWLEAYCHEKGYSNQLTWGDWQRPSKKEDEEKTSKNEAQQEVAKKQIEQEEDTASPTLTLPKISILHDPGKPDVTAKERGNYIHAVLQEIRTADEADEVIERLYLRHDIDPEVICHKEMTESIHKLLEMPEVAPWFRQGLTVLNEQTIMGEEKMSRPDRIIMDEQGHATVIDYKTGSLHKGQKAQVMRYMGLLRQIGFKTVSGYLLFIKDQQVLAIKK